MRALDAKVSGRVVDASSLFFSDAMACTAGAGAGAPKGFALPDCEEKGFATPAPGLEEKGLEKGFAEAEAPAPFCTPKSDSPILGCGFSSGLSSFFSILAAGILLPAPFVMRTPRMPLTLPSFLLHVLRRHVQMYNRRSWPGKVSGMSPLSSSKRLRRPLQTLHLAREPEGAVLSSIQLYCTA